MPKVVTIFPLLIIVVIISTIFSPYLLGYIGYTPHVGPNDLTNLQIPLRHELQQSIKNGKLPLWENKISAGFPLFAEGQIGALHPINILFALLPVPSYYSVSLSIVTAITISALTMYCYFTNSIKQIAEDKLTSLQKTTIGIFVSIGWALNGMHINHIAHLNILNVICWLPLQLWASDKIQKSQKPQAYLLILSITIGLQLLSGHPQMTAYCLLGVTLYHILTVCTSKITKDTIKTSSLFIMALILGIGLGAVQILPTLEFSQNSTRQGGLTEESANFLALRLEDIPRLILPFYNFTEEPRTLARLAQIGWPFDERYSYTGILPLILAIIGIPFIITRKIGIKYLVLGTFFTLLAFGTQTPLGILLRIPPLNMFRIPVKFTIFFQLAVIILAGIAIVELFKIVKLKNNVAQTVLTILILIQTIDVGTKIYQLYPVVKGEWWYSEPQTITEYKKQIKTNTALLNPILGQDFDYQIQKQYLEGEPQLWTKNQAQLFKNNQALAPSFLMLQYNIPLLTNAVNSAGLKVKWYSDIEKELFFTPPQKSEDNELTYPDSYWKLARLAGTKYVLHDATLNDNNVQQLFKTNYTTRQDQIALYKLNEPLPFVDVPEKIEVTEQENTLNKIKEPTFNPQTTAIILRKDQSQNKTQKKVKNIQIAQTEATNLKIKLTTEESAIALIRQAYFPGWNATVNGKEIPVIRLNHAFQGVKIPTAGTQNIEVKYNPNSFKYGLIISIVSVFLLIVIAILSLFNKKS